jgi:hypothetical protein
MAPTSAKFEWSSVIRVAMIVGGGFSALFAPLMKAYPLLNQRLINWPDPHTTPDNLTLAINLFVSIAILCLASFGSSIIFLGVLLNIRIKIPDSAFWWVSVIAAIVWLIWANNIHFTILMLPLRKFGLFRWQMALSGFEAYLFAAAWISLRIFKKNPFSPDPDGVNIIIVPEWFVDGLARVAVGLFAFAALSVIAGAICMKFDSLDAIMNYAFIGAHLSMVTGFLLLLFSSRFLKVPIAKRMANHGTTKL